MTIYLNRFDDSIVLTLAFLKHKYPFPQGHLFIITFETSQVNKYPPTLSYFLFTKLHGKTVVGNIMFYRWGSKDRRYFHYIVSPQED